ncbi:MAG: TolC family protein [Bacteroidetes bacterium]|nr:TolC family protein [Bacteroidota bacterium]
MRQVFLFAIILMGLPAGAQVLKEFPLSAVYSIVMENHPVARQASMLPDQAKAEIRAARGSFDPKLSVFFDEKDFDGKKYWNRLDGMLKVPAWIGDFKGSFERNRGNYISAYDNTPLSGLLTAGYSLPIGAGLLIDERRSTLRQARELSKINAAEQVKVINKLLLQVAVDYWNWYQAYRQLTFVNEAYQLADIRFEAVKEMSRQGSQSALDTVEAYSNLLTRNVQLIQSRVEYLNAGLLLANHLWDPDSQPVVLDTLAIPQRISSESLRLDNNTLDSLRTYALENHPELIKLGAKINQLEIEKRFRAEMLKPNLTLEYNFLQSGVGNVSMNNGFFMSNYKAGFQFEMPLFLRKERGKYQGAKIKLSLAELEQINTRRLVETEVLTRYNELKNFEQLFSIQSLTYDALKTMVVGEQEKFRNGESSVFVINARETKLIEAGMKLADFESKYAKSIAYLYWASGQNTLNIP